MSPLQRRPRQEAGIHSGPHLLLEDEGTRQNRQDQSSSCVKYRTLYDVRSDNNSRYCKAHDGQRIPCPLFLYFVTPVPTSTISPPTSWPVSMAPCVSVPLHYIAAAHAACHNLYKHLAIANLRHRPLFYSYIFIAVINCNSHSNTVVSGRIVVIPAPTFVRVNSGTESSRGLIY